MRLFHQLTEREEEILALVANGYENKTIAQELHISVFTVQTHLQNLFEHLGVRNRTEAASKYWQTVWLNRQPTQNN
jgi:two-component system, NarL family, response regulator LiaR